MGLNNPEFSCSWWIGFENNFNFHTKSKIKDWLDNIPWRSLCFFRNRRLSFHWLHFWYSKNYRRYVFLHKNHWINENNRCIGRRSVNKVVFSCLCDKHERGGGIAVSFVQLSIDSELTELCWGDQFQRAENCISICRTRHTIWYLSQYKCKVPNANSAKFYQLLYLLPMGVCYITNLSP